MNDYPVVIEEKEENEQLGIYHNYKKDVKSVVIKAIATVIFLFFTVKLVISVILDTPQLGYNLAQIVAKYEYILEGVPMAYMMSSVNLVYGLLINYILISCCILDTIWFLSGTISGIISLVKGDKVSSYNLWYFKQRYKTKLFFLRWNVVSAIVIIILKISKIIIF